MRPSNPEALTTAQIEALTRVAGAGAALASEAMTRMTRRPVAVLSPRVRAIRIAQVADFLGGAEALVVALRMRIHGPFRGDMLIALSPESAGWLLAAVLERPRAHPDLGNLTRFEESGLLEIGNTMAGSYLSALSNIAKQTLLLSIPEIAIDMAGAVVDDLLAETTRGAATVLLIDMALAAGPLGRGALMLHLLDPVTLPLLVSALSGARDGQGCDAIGGV